MVYKVCPNIEEIGGGDVTIRQKLGEALTEAWPKISQSYMDTLIESMEARVQAVIAAE
ncbi:MAG: hypothetical protein M1835_003627, partial [Candelina submexicana]